MNDQSLILLLGSNQGNRVEMLAQAQQRLHTKFGAALLKSSVYQTQAWGNTRQPDFLNQVISYDFTGTALQALHLTQQIELELGRVRNQPWGPRTIDIDILYFGQLVYQTDGLVIPHPALHLRRFTLAPLAEIFPDFLHPVLQKTQRQLLAACPDKLNVELL
ncbi:MAG: 2-amino-4-hydroxy-6-hydroxymethyldihydropteridine diphosphokinase [Cyclobacteriaceae bacterium]|nr:2-amino-4-hydroxy-6-hydroxymethyldihydropteridine diphosphokinase [Cyclobacteriaceae bacterium]